MREEILKILEKNSRLSPKDIAAMIGMDEQAVAFAEVRVGQRFRIDARRVDVELEVVRDPFPRKSQRTVVERRRDARLLDSAMATELLPGHNAWNEDACLRREPRLSQGRNA